MAMRRFTASLTYEDYGDLEQWAKEEGRPLAMMAGRLLTSLLLARKTAGVRFSPPVPHRSLDATGPRGSEPSTPAADDDTLHYEPLE
mgnify:CR=1 FL=1